MTLPKGSTGPWQIAAAMPGMRRAARVLGASILVTPAVLPRLRAKLAGGRAAPGGAVDVDVALTDEKGEPLVGSVAALMIDARGGGSTAGLERSTRAGPLPALLGRGGPLRSAGGGRPGARPACAAPTSRGSRGKPLAPAIDPGADVNETLRRAFASVLLSLEGAVRDASRSPDQLRDVRRKVGSAWQFNPELMTLVTAAMPAPPTTPGGEPLALGDLIAIDPQVTFDNVARRIARAKLFHVLAAVREFRHEHHLDPDEPALKSPTPSSAGWCARAALDRAAILVDPWGGTIQFVEERGAAHPLPLGGEGLRAARARPRRRRSAAATTCAIPSSACSGAGRPTRRRCRRIAWSTPSSRWRSATRP